MFSNYVLKSMQNLDSYQIDQAQCLLCIGNSDYQYNCEAAHKMAEVDYCFPGVGQIDDGARGH